MQFQTAQCKLYPESLFCKALDSMVDLYQISGSECGQVALAKKYEPYAIKFDKSLKEGTCASQGYTVADGSKDMKVPFIGDIKIAEFKKAAVEEEQVTLFQITGTECGESTLPKKYETYAIKFDSDLKEGNCASQGYTVPDGSKDITVPFIGKIHTDDFKKPAALEEEQVTLFQITGTECGESTLPKKYETYAIKFDSDLKEGNCVAQGYTVPDGSKDITVPFIGKIHTADFKKPAGLEEEQVTLYAIAGPECGESTLPKKYESYAEKFDSDLKEGSCASQGYTVPDGSKDIKVPFIGTIHTAQFKKSAELAKNHL